MKKRFVSLLLAFSMMLTFLPVGAVSAFADDAEKPMSGSCGKYPSVDDVKWELTQNNGNSEEATYTLTLTGTGSGEMASYYTVWDKIPWKWASSRITKIEILDGVTTIGQAAFWACSILESVEIPDNVTWIGYTAFAEYNNLKRIYLPFTVPEIAGDAFRGLSSKIYYPGSKTDWLNQPNVKAGKIGGLNTDNRLSLKSSPICYRIDVPFDANGGKFSDGNSIVTVQSYRTENIEASKIPAPTRDGYKLLGWCTDPNNAENTIVDPTDIKNPDPTPWGPNYDGVYDDIKLYAVWEAIPDHELTVKGGTFTYDENAASNKGSVYEGALVTVTLDEHNQLWTDSGLNFGYWDIQSKAKLLDESGEEIVNPGKTFTFVMPKEGVTIEAMPKDATIEDDGPGVLGTAAIIGAVGVGGAVLAYQGYQLGTEAYLNYLLPAGAAIPNTRAELAKLLWQDAECPAAASDALYSDISADDTDTQTAARWAVEQQLMDLPDADQPDAFAPDTHVSRMTVIKAWNAAQALK